jgi:hypothetical protein
MERTLAAFAASHASLDERLRVVRALAAEVQDLHRRGRAHGALSPASVRLAGMHAVIGAAPRAAAPGFDAPEVARGGPPPRRSDAFALGALARLALTGAPPFGDVEPLEAIRRVLFEAPEPARLAEPRLSREIDAAIASLLEKRPRRRGTAGDLLRAVTGGATATPTPTATATPTATPTPTATATATATSTSTATSTPTPTPTIGLATPARLLPSGAFARIAIVAAVTVALTLGVGLGGDAALAREVGAAIARGDHAAARRQLEEVARERGRDPLVEKLRGDLACASGGGDECVRRYRVALAARPEYREDPVLRRNARALLRRELGCGTRRSAAQLLGELRDRGALPALEEARRGGGVLAFLCTGDAIDRAIAATRAAPE